MVVPRISAADIVDGHLHITFDDGQRLDLPWFWVRDHSEDLQSFDPATGQRNVDTFSIDRAIRPESVSLADGVIRVSWAGDDPESLLSLATLGPLVSDDRSIRQRRWRDPADATATSQPWADVMSGAKTEPSDAWTAWLADLDRYGFALMHDAPTTLDDAQALADRIGYVRHTIFGGVYTLSAEEVPHADSAYGTDTLLPHTDGTYSHDAPGLQFFLCSERTGTGGESVLVDGFAAAAALREGDPDAFDILTRVDVPGRYLEDGVSLLSRRPTIRLDATGEVEQITVNNYDRAPFVLPEPDLSAWYDAYAAFHEIINDRSSWWIMRLEPGDCLMLDNWRCLHGRMGFSGRRVFHGAYLNHEDLESRLRTVQIA